MNTQEAKKVLNQIFIYAEVDKKKVEYLNNFIDEVEALMKNNSIKQTPALFKPFEKGG